MAQVTAEDVQQKREAMNRASDQVRAAAEMYEAAAQHWHQTRQEGPGKFESPEWNEVRKAADGLTAANKALKLAKGEFHQVNRAHHFGLEMPVLGPKVKQPKPYKPKYNLKWEEEPGATSTWRTAACGLALTLIEAPDRDCWGRINDGNQIGTVYLTSMIEPEVDSDGGFKSHLAQAKDKLIDMAIKKTRATIMRHHAAADRLSREIASLHT